MIQALDEPNSYWLPVPAWDDHRTLRDLAIKERNIVLDQLSVVYNEINPLEEYALRALNLDDESTIVVRQIAGMEFLTFADWNTDLEDKATDQVISLWALEDDELIDLVVKTIGAAASILKKSFVGDRRIELISAGMKLHPGAIISRLQRSAVLSTKEYQRTAERMLSVGVGSLLGRLDWRMLRREEMYSLPDIFSPLPRIGPFEIALNDSPSQEELELSADGILVDDPDHGEDVVRRMRMFMEAIWKNDAEAIEKEACGILGLEALRDYFRRSGNGGFWDDHVSRYSKSRRKAPIYWLLQSSNKNYALWLYYHRLDKDLLFKALVNYVEPKVRLETSRLETLRKQKAEAGDSSKEATRLAKELERQEDFLSELRDFEDKLRRAANLHLEPDFNDGVVLNIAPLWELVPWKEAKNHWDELLKGEYEWSSIGKQLRQKALVK